MINRDNSGKKVPMSCLRPEPCKELLEKLEQKSVYRRSHCQFFGASGDTRLASEEDGSFDAVVVAGAFIKGHLSADALREAARLVRKGIGTFEIPKKSKKNYF